MKIPRRLRIVLVVFLLLLVSAAAFLFYFRRFTRLRLDYPPGEVERVEDEVYVEGSEHPKHRLDLYMPSGKRGVPVVLTIHGGYWTGGDRNYWSLLTGLYGSVGTALAKRGVGCVIPSYRLSPEVDIDGILDDVAAAIRWTLAGIEERGGDPLRLFVMGHSAGGHIAALLGADPRILESRGVRPGTIRGVIALSAVWDVADMRARNDDDFNQRVTRTVFGGEPERWQRYSPVEHLGAETPPFLVAIGERDYGYLIGQARAAWERLRALDPRNRFLDLAGADHSQMVLEFGARGDRLTGAVVEFVESIR